MCYQSSGYFSAIWDRGDAYLSHSFLNPEISQFIVFKLIWPSGGTFNNIITLHTQTPARQPLRPQLCVRIFNRFCVSFCQRGALFGNPRGASSELGSTVDCLLGNKSELSHLNDCIATVRVSHSTQCIAV